MIIHLKHFQFQQNRHKTTIFNCHWLLKAIMSPRAAYLIIACCAMVHMNTVGSDSFIYHVANRDGSSAYVVSQGITYLLYPLLGWMADVYFTRYKFVQVSFIAVIVTSVLSITISAFVLFTALGDYRALYYSLGGITMALGMMGLGMFEATAIQFGMDQMLESPSEQLSNFIHWYYWSCNVGQLLITYTEMGVVIRFSMCIIDVTNIESDHLLHHIHPFEVEIACISIIIMGSIQFVSSCVGLCLITCSKKHLNIDRTGDHPLKLIYQVLKYAWKHKCPERRSAFTYWEEDIPPRIDLGKSKYGGPFTTEEVEDTKTFLRILLLLVCLAGYQLSGHGYSLLSQLMKAQCPSKWVFALIGDPMHITLVVIVIGVPIYQFIILRYFQQYLPNMLKRMGLGLLCCLIKEVIDVIIHATMIGSQFCKHVDKMNIDSCFLLEAHVVRDNGTCINIAEATDNHFECIEHNVPFLLLVIPNLLQGLSFLLVFMTALEFICAQAPLRLKGLLIGVWYAFLAINYLGVQVAGITINALLSWEVFHEVKSFIIFLFLMLYVCVSTRYSYRKRDEVVNEQYLIEEIYERELDIAEKIEQEKLLSESISTTASKTYGLVQ